MTNDDIERQAALWTRILQLEGRGVKGRENDNRTLADAMRELVAQAYEEAAQAAENQLGVSGYAYAEDEHKLIAQYIRSLKDSLVSAEGVVK